MNERQYDAEIEAFRAFLAAEAASGKAHVQQFLDRWETKAAKEMALQK
jgi:hypothetical protein